MDLIEQFLSFENFRIAGEKVAKNQGCAGFDGETIPEFANNLEADL